MIGAWHGQFLAVNMVKWNIFNIMLMLVFICFSIDDAHGNGELLPVNGSYSTYVNLIENQPDNTPGAISVINTTMASSISATVYCEKNLPSSSVLYYSASTFLSPSKSNPGYLHLNDYLDIKVEVYIGEGVMDYVTVPFSSVSNKMPARYSCNQQSPITGLTSGTRARLTFKTTKSIINGLNMKFHNRLMSFTGTYGLQDVAGSTHSLSFVSLSGGTLTVPDKCVINNGVPLSIEFGLVGSSGEKLNGNNYKKSISINVQCQGGSFNKGSLNIKMGFQTAGSDTASFNQNYLGTKGSVNRNDLGIIIRDKSNNVVVPNRFYDLDSYSSNRGRWDLTAAPIAKPGKDIPEGEFYSNAVIVAQFN